MKALLVLALVLFPTLLAAAPRVLFHDDFSSYPAGSEAESRWEALSGLWQVQNGRLRAVGKVANLVYAHAAPESDDQTITALIHIGRRNRVGSWAHAGLVLAQDFGNYWHLALVEAPDGTRYGELGEQYDRFWQAQVEGATRLPKQEGVSETWEPGDFRFTLRVSPEGIQGTIAEAGSGRVVFQGGYGFPGNTPAVRSGRAGVKAVDLRADVAEVTVSSEREPEARSPGTLAAGRLAVMQANLPGMPPELPERLAAAMRAAGWEAALVSPAEVAKPDFTPGRYGVVVVPQCQTFPAEAYEGLTRYLRGGGNLVALGGPIFSRLLYADGAGKWLSWEEVLASAKPEHTALTWEDQDLDRWGRATSHPQYHLRYGRAPAPEGQGRVLRMDFEHLDGWDNITSPDLGQVLKAEDGLIIFEGKANENINIAMEWKEEDGTRWIAAIPLTRKWERHVVPLADFKFWPDSSPPTRGGPGDFPHPERMRQFSLGLAQSHGSYPTGGPYTVWIGNLGAAPSPINLQHTPTLLEGMSPEYKVYRTKADRAAPYAGQVVLAEGGLDAPFAAVCPIARARGLGSEGARPGRWIPLLEAYVGNDLRGAVASTWVAFTGPFRRASWTAIGLPDSKYVLAHLDQVAPVIAAAAKRACQGLWLVKGGSDAFCYFADEPASLGAQVANLTPGERQVVVRLTLTGPQGQVVSQENPVALPALASARLALDKAQTLAPGLYTATVELREDGRLVDRIAHEFRVLAAPTDGQPLTPALSRGERENIVTQHDGQFWLQGKPWHPHGVNYWPSNVTGLEPFEYWLHWLSQGQYDPEVVERDLARLQALGANAVSIQLNTVDQVPALNDFLARALAHGIRVNVFLSGAHPLQSDLELCTAMLARGRFAGNPAIYAYDLAWEPAVGNADARRRLEPAWTEWVKDRYGSLEVAMGDWGFSPEIRENGDLAGPTQEQILNDGDARVMVAAFRRFLDDHISAGYARVIAALRPYDDTHLWGARTGYGGTGQEGVDPAMPFDLAAGAKHLDFTSPEGYGMGGAWENFAAGGLITEYGRWAGDGRPVFWAEFGYTIYPGITPERYVKQGRHYAYTYRMVQMPGAPANGSAGWWFPGGVRLGENSDYGVMNPDGTPRPAAQAMKQYSAWPAPAGNLPVHEITIDRDLHPRGTSQIWRRHRAEFLQAVRAGERVVLRTAGTGTTSVDCPPVAVGNVPWTGHNPPKYLNGEFYDARREGADLVVSVGNTGEAKWLTPASAAGKPGAVYVVALAGDKEVARAPITADVPRYGDASVRLPAAALGTAPVRLILLAEGRTRFGGTFVVPPPGL